MKAKLVNENLNEFLDVTHSFEPIAEIIEGEEILVNLDVIEKLFGYIGDGIYDISVDSIYSHQTGEYTNTVEIEFEENTNGNISMEEWNQAEQILEEYVGNNGFESYEIIPSHNKIVLEFAEDLPLGY